MIFFCDEVYVVFHNLKKNIAKITQLNYNKYLRVLCFVPYTIRKKLANISRAPTSIHRLLSYCTSFLHTILTPARHSGSQQSHSVKIKGTFPSLHSLLQPLFFCYSHRCLMPKPAYASIFVLIRILKRSSSMLRFSARMLPLRSLVHTHTHILRLPKGKSSAQKRKEKKAKKRTKTTPPAADGSCAFHCVSRLNETLLTARTVRAGAARGREIMLNKTALFPPPRSSI